MTQRLAEGSPTHREPPWAIASEPDPYLESLTTFHVPPLDPSVDRRLDEDQLTAGLFGPQRYQAVALVDYYGLHLAIDLVDRLELAPLLTHSRSVPELREAAGFVPDFGAPLRWVLERLAGAGLVYAEARDAESTYRIDVPLSSPRTGWLREQAASIDASILPTLDLMDAAGEGYPRVAHGELTGERWLWTSIKRWGAFLNEESWYYDLTNEIAARAAAARLVSSGNEVLEVGAGFGSGTRALLRALSRRDTAEPVQSFLVTEPDPFARRRLTANLEGFLAGRLELAELDINRGWTDQGAEPERFTLVYGVNVFHLAKDLELSLAEAFRALAPGGWLVLGEGIRPFDGQPLSIELVFQLLRDFVDVPIGPNRPTHGFLVPEAWRAALQAAGFGDVEIVPDLVGLRRDCPRFTFGAVCGRKSPVV